MNMKPIGGMLLLMVSTFAFAQQSFSTPEQAANAPDEGHQRAE